MTIESVAFIDETNGFKVSKDKTVIVTLDKKVGGINFEVVQVWSFNAKILFKKKQNIYNPPPQKKKKTLKASLIFQYLINSLCFWNVSTIFVYDKLILQ